LAEIQRASLDDAQREGSAIIYFAIGKKSESDAALRDAIKRDAQDWPYGIACVYAYREDLDQAAYWLEKAYAQKDPDMYLIKGDPLLRNLEGDARYKKVLHEMNLPE
jgi:hypothetical protein